MNLYLIGYRGSGKSTVAPLVAKDLKRPSIDSDHLIVQKNNCSIADIFANSGETEFRRIEQQIVKQLGDLSNHVVSLGGGVPMFESNRMVLAATGKTVYLNGSPDVLWSRIAQDAASDELRPSLTDLDAKAEVDSLVNQRHPIYADCADYMIEVNQLSPQQIAEQIVQWWKSVDK